MFWNHTELTKWPKQDAKKRPKLNSYMMVMMWTNDDDLFNYIKKTYNDEKYTWYGLHFPAIGDLELCGNYNKTRILIGVTFFIAPESLKENKENPEN
ncbi:kinase-like domain-containing protein [Rhizophagus irregularis DAOM 181602=DAOM 197198]|nr:kinase-like domain-containing protein [Rhizophagus irregularis DAOM 181602=DAOM 197198]CAG8615229.1 10058_t:CDS:2 [Rhizophagus irregularis]